MWALMRVVGFYIVLICGVVLLLGNLLGGSEIRDLDIKTKFLIGLGIGIGLLLLSWLVAPPLVRM